MTSIRQVVEKLEAFAPLSHQESYDNSGLITGDQNDDVRSVLVSLDCTEEVVEEAVERGCNLIVSHHPILFGGIKKLTGKTYVERTLIKAIKNNVAIYACHTNLDSVRGGVNSKIAEKLSLHKTKILDPQHGQLRKLVTYCPLEHAEVVRKAIFEAGAGHIGNYDHCSFNASGKGTFRAGDESQPFVGEINKDHEEEEIRIESIYPSHLEKNILKSLFEVHPYEEVAYDIYPLKNSNQNVGIGIVGELQGKINLHEFLNQVKSIFKVGMIRHTKDLGKKVQKVAVCGGSGSFLIPKAIASEADVFLTSDIKYHQFFDAEEKIVLVDIGHFESEQFTIDLLSEFLTENFNTFATYFSQVNTNPINYF